jgi:molybdopterin-binding protein/molybdate transport repressor ModE-like protein
LLEAVRDYSSISAVGRSMGMSYRRACLLIDELNHIFEEPVIDAKHAGSGGGGAELTAFGHRIVERYRSIEAKAHAAAAADLDALAAVTLKPPLDRSSQTIAKGGPAMKLSARNQIKGKLVEVRKGTTTAHIRIDIGNGVIITASITNEAVDDLGLRDGDEAIAVIKASDVMVAK